MTINKYQGKTKEEAVEKAKQELGAGAVVLNVKEIKPKGMFKMFKNTLYEVTAAVRKRKRSRRIRSAARQSLCTIRSVWCSLLPPPEW